MRFRIRQRNKLRQFNKRVICSGNVLEIYEYEKPVEKGYQSHKKAGRGNTLNTDEETKTLNRGKTAQRARATVRRYANANPQLNKFVTLTFAENIVDLDFARYEFDKVCKRIKTRYKNFQYIAVIEFQKRGAIHYHLLCNLPYISADKLAKIWGHGFVKINRVDNVDNVGAYISKYMSKDNIDDRLKGRKCYTMSKTLKKPEIYTEETDIEYIMERLENIKRIHTMEFFHEHYGKIHYTQIVCSSALPSLSWLEQSLRRFAKHLLPLPDKVPCPF